MFNDEDITVASLAKIVGSELTMVDRFTEKSGSNSGPSNKIDPRSFLTKNSSVRQAKSNVVTHDGKLFHAGVDESLVQSMYPDPVSVRESLPENQRNEQRQDSVAFFKPDLPVLKQENSSHSIAENEILIKILQSIDKSLKSIDKTEKNIAKLLTKSSID